MATVFTDDFESYTANTAPAANWTEEDAGTNWRVQTAPAGLTGKALEAIPSATLDDFIRRTFTRQTAAGGVLTVAYKAKTGTSTAANVRYCNLYLLDSTTVVAQVMFLNGNIVIQPSGASVTLQAFAASTVYTVLIDVNLSTGKFTVTINGTLYDNAGAGYTVQNSATGIDRVRMSRFSTSTTGGSGWYDEFSVTSTLTAPGVGTIGTATIDKYARVTLPFTAGTGTPTSLVVYRSAGNSTFVDVTAQCAITDNGSGSWTVIDRRPHYGSQKVATYGGTGYYKIAGVNAGGEGTASAVKTVASITYDQTAVVAAHEAVMHTAIAAQTGGKYVSSSTGEAYPGYWLMGMAEAYRRSGTSSYLTDVQNQWTYTKTLANADGIIGFPDFNPTTEAYKDHHSRTVLHALLASKALRRAGETTTSAEMITYADTWAKAGIDHLARSDVTRAGSLAATRTAWVASTAYSVGAVVRPTVDNSRTYRCTIAGTASGTQPTWPTTAGATVTDGTVTWEETTRTAGIFAAIYNITGAGAPFTYTPDVTDGYNVDMNQEMEIAAGFSLLLNEPTSSFFAAGAYRTAALDIILDATEILIPYQSSTGGVKIGDTSAVEDTLYGGYTASAATIVVSQAPSSAFSPRLSSWLSRLMDWMDTSYSTEPNLVNHYLGDTDLAAAEIGYRDAVAFLLGRAQPLAGLVYTAAFSNPATDKQTKYSATGNGAAWTPGDSLESRWLSGLALLNAGVLIVPTSAAYPNPSRRAIRGLVLR